MENKENKHRMRSPATFAYTVNCVGFNLEDQENPKFWWVDYQASPNIVEKRIPAGKFQTQDLIKAIEFFLDKTRNQDLEYFCIEALKLDEIYKREKANVTDYVRLNQSFTKLASNLMLAFIACNKSISEDVFYQLIYDTQLNSIRRELAEEIDSTRSNTLYLSSVGKTNDHYQICFTSVDIDAPDFYAGSGDSKILQSELVSIDQEILPRIFPKHLNMFQGAIRTVCEQNLHPNAHILKKYNKASD